MVQRIFGAFAAVVILLGAAAHGQNNPSVNPSTRAAAVEAVASQIEENFYDNAKAKEIAAELRDALASGAYDGARDAAALADLMTQTLQPHDKHFGVRYTGPPERGSNAPPGGGGPFSMGPHINYGFNEVKILPGNVGYIKMRFFFPVEGQAAGETALAALNFVKNADAVIFDLRENGGGAPSMVQLLISHFLDPQNTRPINTFLSSSREYPAEMISLAYLPAGARPDVPLYVLTSGATGSAGEAFPYHLQAMERATIVGETTAGAGNPGGLFYAGEGFSVFISTSRTKNPVTGTNWEGVGVAPDEQVPAEEALDHALKLAYGEILETAEDAGHRTSLEWALEALEAKLNPAAYDVSDYQDIIGEYGPRSITSDGENLYYQRGEQAARKLAPVGEDRFMIDGLDNYRLIIQRDRRGRIVSLSLEQPGAPPSVSARSS